MTSKHRLMGVQVLVILFPWILAAAGEASPEFSVDQRLQKNVEFWVKIYSHYGVRQAVIHDAKHIERVYEVVELSGSEARDGRLIAAAKAKWRKILPARDRSRVRAQLGQRERFLDGLRESGRYLSIMEKIFEKEGLPRELTRLPFVESSFNSRARSKAGASGIWQFMRSTARLFLRVDRTVDERNDPIRSTEAAVKLLKMNYESLKSWPLAITAYNHGRGGVMRAVRRVKSENLSDLVETYRNGSFGFASGNFFAEFLAAVEVERNSEKYFGKIEKLAPIAWAELKLPDFISFNILCRYLRLDPMQVRHLNLALSDRVFAGEQLIPSGYVLRIPTEQTLSPDGAARVFWAGYEQIPHLFKLRAQKPLRYVRN